MMHRLVVWSFVVAIALMPAAALAEGEETADAEGSRDHPAVKRYPGAHIFGDYQEKEFEAAYFAVSAAKAEHVEGKYYQAVYMYPEKSGCTQVMRNYENALTAANMKLYTGTGLPEAADTWAVNGAVLDRWATGIGTGAKGGKIYIFIGCTENAFSQPAGPVMVVETQAMEQKVEINAGTMAEEIEKTGRVALYGINFATGKADITPDSARTLAEIGALLAAKPEWKLRIEGHTDNVGAPKTNLELSERRAAAVKDWLMAKHGVKADRLATLGLGDTQPVADNKTGEGRTKNRRVELVKP